MTEQIPRAFILRHEPWKDALNSLFTHLTRRLPIILASMFPSFNKAQNTAL